MKIKSKSILLAIILLFGAAQFDAVAQKNKKDKKKKGKETQQFDEENPLSLIMPSKIKDKQQAEYLFTEGVKFYILEEYDEALGAFKESEDMDSGNSATKFKIAQIYNKLNEVDKAFAYAEKALKLDGSNAYYYVLLANLYQQKQDFEKVAETYRSLIKNVEGTQEYYYDLAQAYLQLSDFERAIDAYNEAEKALGLNEPVIRQKQRIYLNIEKIDDAIAEGQKLVDAYPGVNRYILSQAEILLSNNRLNMAEDLLRKMLAEDPEEPGAQLLMAKTYLLKGEQEEAYEYARNAFLNPNLSFSDKLEILMAELQYLYSGKPNEQGKKLAKIAAEVHPDVAQANSIYADFLAADEQKVEARDYYLKSLSVNEDDFKVWQRVLNIDWGLQQFDSLELHSSDALELYPNQVMLYLYNGTALYVNKEYEEAMAILEQGRMYAMNPDQRSQFSAQLGDVYNNLEEYEKSDEAYEEVLEIDPNNVHVLNNYSYFLSLRKEKLERAKEMGKKLVELEPTNTTYLDTYGWVLYSAGEYEASRKYLQQAAENSDDGTIFEHYGDALYKLNEKEKALEYWKKALEAGGSEDEALLKKKIAKGGLID